MEANSIGSSSAKSGGESDGRKRILSLILGGAGFALLVAAIWGLFMVGSAKAGKHSRPFVVQNYAEIDLDVIHREIPGQPGGRFRETFFCQPILVLNSDMDNFKEVLAHIKKRKNSLRGELFRIIYTLPIRFFRGEDLLDKISELFLDAINLFLGPNYEGKEIVQQVVFPLFEAPTS
jgi:hypothetical protein